MPFLLGMILIVIGATSRSSRWMYVNVDRSHQEEWPKHITLALPLPLGLVSWFLANFGSHIDGLNRTSVDEIIQAIAMTKHVNEPLIVNVDEGNDGEKVQVFIG
jgi:hypothetical protein